VISFPKTTQQSGNTASKERLKYSDSQKLSLGNRLELGFHRIARMKNILDGFEQTRPGCGRHHRGAPPIEQFDVEFRFKLRNAGRNCRLRDSRALCAFRETAGLDDCDEVFDLMKLHRIYYSLLAPVVITSGSK
jgi:hypothetical protein